jgi:hypothetical protein
LAEQQQRRRGSGLWLEGTGRLVKLVLFVLVNDWELIEASVSPFCDRRKLLYVQYGGRNPEIKRRIKCFVQKWRKSKRNW